MYEALIMVRPGHEDGVFDRFLTAVEASEAFKEVSIARDGNSAVLAHDGGVFKAHFSQEPHVAIESAEIAGWYDHPENEHLAQSTARIELSGPPDDLDLWYMNDALLYAEIAVEAGRGWWFDPAGGVFPDL